MSLDWIGSTLLALCGLPAAYNAYKLGKADDISTAFLTLWLGGEVFLLADRLPKHDWALITNYLCNILFIGIILKYKFYPRRVK